MTQGQSRVLMFVIGVVVFVVTFYGSQYVHHELKRCDIPGSTGSITRCWVEVREGNTLRIYGENLTLSAEKQLPEYTIDFRSTGEVIYTIGSGTYWIEITRGSWDILHEDFVDPSPTPSSPVFTI